jgi:hypothetical protein
MIGALARAAAFVGVPAPLVYFAVYGLITALIASTYAWTYYQGSSAAKAKCNAAELERVIYAQAVTVSRYREAAEQTVAQAAQEVREAEEQQRLIAESLALEQADDAMLEAALTAAVTDKEKLDAALKRLRSQCAASDRDVDLDRRLRGQ